MGLESKLILLSWYEKPQVKTYKLIEVNKNLEYLAKAITKPSSGVLLNPHSSDSHRKNKLVKINPK